MKSLAHQTLLLVDDEDRVLQSLKHLFRREGYRILSASSGQEGLELLKAHPVAVVVSDQMMPAKSGCTFLQEVAKRHPDSVRIILSGYTEFEAVTNAVNTGALYKFQTKFWEDAHLVDRVADAFKQYALNAESRSLTRQLKRANRILEDRVDTKIEEARFNLKSLQLYKEILEELPMAILAISDDQVVVANRKARSLYEESACLRGMRVWELGIPLLSSLYEQTRQSMQAQQLPIEHAGARFTAECQPCVSGSQTTGFILTLRS